LRLPSTTKTVANFKNCYLLWLWGVKSPTKTNVLTLFLHLIATKLWTSSGVHMNNEQFFQTLWSNQQGQDIAEYAVMLALILVLVVGTVRLVGSNANNAFSSVASSIQ